jgi:hypothetical protein
MVRSMLRQCFGASHRPSPLRRFHRSCNGLVRVSQESDQTDRTLKLELSPMSALEFLVVELPTGSLSFLEVVSAAHPSSLPSPPKVSESQVLMLQAIHPLTPPTPCRKLSRSAKPASESLDPSPLYLSTRASGRPCAPPSYQY